MRVNMRDPNVITLLQLKHCDNISINVITLYRVTHEKWYESKRL